MGIANPTALSAGSYTYTVTDANNCSFTDSIIIYEPINFNINVVTTDVSCNGLNNGTAVVKIQGNNTPTGTVSTQSYCSSTPGSSSYSNIELVQLFGDNFNIDNNTAGICDQYEDYTTSMYADITEGQNYNLTINLGDCSNMNYSAGGKIFIDWNIDGDFSDPGEEVATIPYGINSTISIPITVPYSRVSGPTRMRVVSQYISTQDVSLIGSCDAGVWAPLYTEPWFGATEDYSIVISAASITASYIWSNGLISDSISGLSAGIYIIDITNGNGNADNSDGIKITVEIENVSTGPGVIKNLWQVGDDITFAIDSHGITGNDIKSDGILTYSDKNKTFYVIQREGKGGLFSNLLLVLNHLLYCDKMKFIPVIDFKNFPTVYS